jgi:hypothetical protein
MINKLALILALAAAQAGTGSVKPPEEVKDCSVARPGTPCTITVDRLAPVSGKTVHVENETAVTVVLIKKSPFESCKNEVKRAELPDVSAIPTLLGMITDLAGSLHVLAAPVEAPARVDPAQQIAAELQQIASEAERQLKLAADVQEAYETETTSLKAFYRTKYIAKKYGVPGVKNEDEFEADRSARETAVEDVLKKELPHTAGGEETYKAVISDYARYLRSTAANPDVIPQLERQISRARSLLDALAKVVTDLRTARTKLTSTADYLAELKDAEWEARADLRPDINAKASGSFSCTSDITGNPTLDPPVAYTVTFQNTPRLSLTAGLIVSGVSRNSVGLEHVEDSPNDPTVTFHNEIRDHPSSPQVVPFSFFNIRLFSPWRWKNRIMTFNATPGVGLNPNNGGTSAEFFLGLSFGFGNFFLAGGAHIGHELKPANGFNLHDKPGDDLKAVPLDTPWTPGLAVAFSYRIPLK